MSTQATALYSSEFWMASGAHFLFLMSFWSFVLFPLHLAALGANESRIGLLIAVEPAAAVLVRPVLGPLLSAWGRRSLIRAGGVVNGFAVASYLFVDEPGVAMVAVRAVHGIGIGALFTTFFTYVADIAPVERRTEALAVFGVSAMLPTAIAPLVGEEIVLRGGFAALFSVALAFSLAALISSWRLPEPSGTRGGAARGFWHLALEPRLQIIWATTLVFSLAMSSYAAFLAPYAHSRGLMRVGLFFFWYSLAAATLRLAGRNLPERIGPRRMLLPALACLAVGLHLLSGLDSFAGLSIAGLLCGMGHAYLFPILGGLAVEGTDAASRANAMSLFTAVFDVGQMIGPAVCGFLAESFGYPGMFSFVMVTVCAMLVLWVLETVRRSAYARFS